MGKPPAIGQGGQALTYCVNDTQTAGTPPCVAKIVNNPEPERRARFLREITVTGRVRSSQCGSEHRDGRDEKQPMAILRNAVL
jgi:hypothetical protein